MRTTAQPERSDTMSRLEDPRLGVYRSAVQKTIRRGAIDDALAAADALLRIPGGRTALARRLSVIAAEDVGGRWIPSVVDATRTARTAQDPDLTDGSLRSVAASLASLPKDKSAYWLAATCWDGRRIAGDVSVESMGQALDRGDHRAAVATYIAAREARQWRSGARVIDALLVRARVEAEFPRAIVEAALWREGQGGSGIDELAAAAVIAIIDRPSGPLPSLPQPPHAIPTGKWQPPFWVFDSHTIQGERAIGRVARRHGMRPEALAWIQFNCESIVLGPSEVPSPWKEEALRLDATAGGWVSQDRAEQIWRELRDEVRLEIERATGG